MVDIGHPGHVHFFKNFIWEMERKGHEMLVTASVKDVTIELLERYGIGHVTTCKRYSGPLLGYEMLRRDVQLFNIAREFKPNFLMGINNTIAAHVSKVSRGRSIIFTDTEHAKLANAITFPFSDVICTPSCYWGEIGKKQIRYNSYHELAYLHPNYFAPDPSVLGEQGLTPGEPFIIVRFVSWKASHDVGQHGIRDKVGFVKALERYGRVLITSEGPLPDELRPYRIRISPDRLHDLLYYANLYVGEGATTASECAILGTHAIYVNTLRLGYIFEEDVRYHLVSDFSNRRCTDETVLLEVKRLLERDNLKNEGREKCGNLIQEKCDTTSFMVGLVEGMHAARTSR